MIDCAGKFLIAPPRMQDWRFQKTVLYMWKHDVTGTNGVIINKPVRHPTFQDICRQGNLERSKGHNPQIYYGGPVMDNLVGVLHTLDVRMATTHIPTPGRGLGYTLDKLMIEHIAQGKVRPKKFRLCLGISSWEVGQLEAELESAPPRDPNSSWLVLNFDQSLCFTDLKEDDMWEKCVNLAINQKTKSFIKNYFD
ncbi:MAG: hypothetical protein CMM91_05550 [Rickettsiales bacterium]|jgi:putative transcriptional regulator|nr:hypothetical protein [Rickettsiales bacterium]|tara:strand:+ start:3130 stop:3714 length:585 start_codon:yes stop_codon:yes gene_type:complete